MPCTTHVLLYAIFVVMAGEVIIDLVPRVMFFLGSRDVGFLQSTLSTLHATMVVQAVLGALLILFCLVMLTKINLQSNDDVDE